MVKKTFDYKDAEEKLVNCTILYGNEERILFYDEEFANKVPTEDYFDLFLAGVVIVDTTDHAVYRPTTCSEGRMSVEDRDFRAVGK